MNHIKQAPKRIIKHFGQRVGLLKRVLHRDTKHSSTEFSYKTKEINFYSVVIKPSDNEIVRLLDIGISDFRNTYKIYTVYKDIKKGDLVSISNKYYEVILVNNHYELGVGYLDFIVTEKYRETSKLET